MLVCPVYLGFGPSAPDVFLLLFSFGFVTVFD